MKRNATILAIALALVLILVAIFLPRSREFSFSDTQITQEEWDKIISTHIYNKYLNLDGVTFNGYELQLDSDNDRYFYSIIEGDDDAYAPLVYFPKNSLVKIATLDPNISYNRTAKNETTRMLIYTSVDYREVELVTTTLPLLNIDTKGHRNLSEEYSDAHIKIFDNRQFAHSRNIESDTKIHIRGSTSLWQEKKSYRLNLTLPNGANNHIGLLGMRKDDDWVLNNLYGDHEKVRNILSAQLWNDCCSYHNEAEAQNSFEYRFVEAFIDNSYAGLYLLGYKPDKKTENLRGDELLFKGKDWSNAEVLANDDNFSRYYELEKGDIDETLAKEELMKYINAIAYGSAEDIYHMFDVDNAIDIELHGMLTQNVDYAKDNKTKNLYLTIKHSPSRSYLLYTPWDFDLSLGNSWKNHTANMSSTDSYGSPIDTIIVTEQMPTGALRRLGDSNIEQKIKARYAELRGGAWNDEHIFGLVDSYERKIFESGAYFREETRWPNGNYLEGAFDLSAFKNYLRERIDFVDSYYGYR
ncbi:MAG: CotH kinase family protein [Candidatus Saccharibacteria bacterium]|nr:CotH kinase family protein [Candidatus Saccharibacteria bacterium]